MRKQTTLTHRHIIEKERGTITKTWGGRTTVCLVFPNHYHVGMSNLGFQIIYRHLNSLSHVVCERAFLPNSRGWEEGTARLLSLESGKPLASFRVIAFSIPFENDFLNVLSILHMAKIPLKAEDRNAKAPLIVAGGTAVSLNPEPLAPFIDLFFIGEGEEVVIDFFRAFHGVARGDREGFVEEVARTDGVYVPSLYRVSYDQHGCMREFAAHRRGIPHTVRRRWIRAPSRNPSYSAIITPLTEFKEMFLLEVNRGCPRGCRFCAARALYAPFRNREVDTLIEEAELGLQRVGRIGLVGSALGDHAGFNELCAYIVRKGGEVSIASIRADAITDRRAELLALSKHRTVAMAPEAGTERMREVVAKGLKDEKIFGAAEILAAHGINTIKLYFIIGLPTETWEDIEGIVCLAKQIRHHLGKGGKKVGEVVLSISPFIPKAWTPFQWHAFEEVKILKAKIKVITQGLRGATGIRVVHEFPKWGYVQALLSMGDRRVAEILLLALHHHGDWRSAFTHSPLNPDFWVYRTRRQEEILPWDFIDHGLNKAQLWEEYQRAVD